MSTLTQIYLVMWTMIFGASGTDLSIFNQTDNTIWNTYQTDTSINMVSRSLSNDYYLTFQCDGSGTITSDVKRVLSSTDVDNEVVDEVYKPFEINGVFQFDKSPPYDNTYTIDDVIMNTGNKRNALLAINNQAYYTMFNEMQSFSNLKIKIEDVYAGTRYPSFALSSFVEAYSQWIDVCVSNTGEQS